MNALICKSNNRYTAYKVDSTDQKFIEFVSEMRQEFRYIEGTLQYYFDEMVGWVDVAEGSYIMFNGKHGQVWPVSKEIFEEKYTIVGEQPWTGWVHVY